MLISSNWTKRSTIQGTIAQLSSNSEGREARARFGITNTLIPWIVQHEVQFLINHIYSNLAIKQVEKKPSENPF